MDRKFHFPCPCCGYFTLDSEHRYDICSVCFWEDDPYQYEFPDYEGGANEMSLNEARHMFQYIGAISEKVKQYVRSPFPYEVPNDP